MSNDQIKFLSIKDVVKKTRLARSTIYAQVALQKFPPPVRVSQRASAWIESEIEEWARNKVIQSRGGIELPQKPKVGR